MNHGKPITSALLFFNYYIRKMFEKKLNKELIVTLNFINASFGTQGIEDRSSQVFISSFDEHMYDYRA